VRGNQIPGSLLTAPRVVRSRDLNHHASYTPRATPAQERSPILLADGFPYFRPRLRGTVSMLLYALTGKGIIDSNRWPVENPSVLKRTTTAGKSAEEKRLKKYRFGREQERRWLQIIYV